MTHQLRQRVSEELSTLEELGRDQDYGPQLRLVAEQDCEAPPPPVKDFSTAGITPTWHTTAISDHAVTQFMDRAMQDGQHIQNRHMVVRRLKYLVLDGRRSDRDKALLEELGPWLRWVHWTNGGRPVVLFQERDSRLCALVVRDRYRDDCLVVLTCFVAADEGPLSKVPLRWT